VCDSVALAHFNSHPLARAINVGMKLSEFLPFSWREHFPSFGFLSTFGRAGRGRALFDQQGHSQKINSLMDLPRNEMVHQPVGLSKDGNESVPLRFLTSSLLNT
jgi:hypothetical protein